MTRSLRWRMTLTMTSRLPKSAATMMKPMAHDLSTTTSTSSQAAALAAAAASPGEAKNKIKKSSYEIDYSVDIPVPKSEVTHVAKPLLWREGEKEEKRDDGRKRNSESQRKRKIVESAKRLHGVVLETDCGWTILFLVYTPDVRKSTH
ncbi:Protein of unknown function [Gryllus bimaculatus]|nr:Protein of unknown function [Gryllus bimaculatus]